MPTLLPHRRVTKLALRELQFEEYRRPSRQLKKDETVEQVEEGDDDILSDVQPISVADYASAPPTRNTRAWKVVDASAILTKRKYIRKSSKANEWEPGGPFTTSVPLSHRNPTPEDEATATPLDMGVLKGVPFECLPDENSTSLQSAMDFLAHDIGAVSMPGIKHATGFSPKVHAFIQLGFDHTIFFHAVVAFAQGYKEVATMGATQPSAMVLYHRGMATKALHARLKDPLTCADDVSILTTFLLVDNVWRYGENEIGKQHYAGLLRMVELRGGLDRLTVDGPLKAMIDFAGVTDVGDSLKGSITTELPDLHYYVHPYPPHVCTMISRLPPGYSDLALQGHISYETMATVVSLNDWIYSDPVIRSPAPHRQIGSARRCLAASNPPSGGTAEEAVCLGVIITSMSSFHARFCRLDHKILDSIVNLSRDFDREPYSRSESKAAHREHLAFLTIVAVTASEKCIELQPQVNTLVDLLLKRDRFARSWDGMERVVRRFFYVPFAIESWRMCWLRQLNRRAEAHAVAAARELRHAQTQAMWKDVIDPELR